MPNAGSSLSARLARTTSGSCAATAAAAAAGAGALGGQHPYGWRDAMDGLVRWRQLAEPNDQVIWVDLLTEREFSAGFGSHTPMFTAQV